MLQCTYVADRKGTLVPSAPPGLHIRGLEAGRGRFDLRLGLNGSAYSKGQGTL